MKINWTRYGIYLIRWQLSTPILAWCIIMFATLGTTWATIIANLIGGICFFWFDRFLFQSEKFDANWQVKEKVICSDCGKNTRGYRLVKSSNYDKRHDKCPKFRCEDCSKIKITQLKKDGVKI